MVRKKPKDTLLRCIRQARGITSDMFADISGVKRQIVYRAEKQEIITNESAEKIAEALGINPEIMFYHMGKLPPGKIELIKKDPLFFMDLIETACADPSKLTKTKEYINNINSKMKDIGPHLSKLLSKVKAPK